MRLVRPGDARRRADHRRDPRHRPDRAPGLLARYDQLGLFDRLRARIMDGGPLRTCWTLLPADDQTDRPLVDGQAVPVLTPNEWARVPRSWLKNLHRAPAQGAA